MRVGEKEDEAAEAGPSGFENKYTNKYLDRIYSIPLKPRPVPEVKRLENSEGLPPIRESPSTMQTLQTLPLQDL